MTKLINKHTNTPMWVADERTEEYLAAGHKPVAIPSVAKTPTEESEEDVKVIKTTTKKQYKK